MSPPAGGQKRDNAGDYRANGKPHVWQAWTSRGLNSPSVPNDHRYVKKIDDIIKQYPTTKRVRLDVDLQGECCCAPLDVLQALLLLLVHLCCCFLLCPWRPLPLGCCALLHAVSQPRPS